jgi:hydroxymethylbilane synthase
MSRKLEVMYHPNNNPGRAEPSLEKEIIIGTRGSKLALRQAEEIKGKLEEKGNKCSLKIIKTKGDKILDVALSKIGDKGLFVKEIEEALIEKTIDIAVHSLKDLPSSLPDRLTIGAIPGREDPRDVVISRDGKKLSELPQSSIIGTSSLRRKSQILAINPGFIVKDIRGNLDTRLRKLQEGEVDCLILAGAGLIRMGWVEKIVEYLPIEVVMPAVGQGAIAVETRKDDKEILHILKEIDDPDSRSSIIAERSFLLTLQGGCQVPIGAFASVSGDTLVLKGLIASLDGHRVFRGEITGDRNKGEELGRKLAGKLLGDGADIILEEIRKSQHI